MWHWQDIYCAKKSAFFAYLKHPKFSLSRTLEKKTFGCYREKLLPRLISHIFPPHSFPPMPPQPVFTNAPIFLELQYSSFPLPESYCLPHSSVYQCTLRNSPPSHTSHPSKVSEEHPETHPLWKIASKRKIWPWEEMISATHHNILKV